jgi:hypothetical protein
MKTHYKDEDRREEIKNMNDVELEKLSKADFFDKFYYFINKCALSTFNATIILFNFFGIYMVWIFLHYFSAHLYVKFCVPDTIIGFIMSPFMISTPHCQGLRWIVYNSTNTINHMWLLIGSWIYSMIWIVRANQ